MKKNFFVSSVATKAKQNPKGFGGIGAAVCRALQANLVDYFGNNIAQFRTLAQVSLIKWLLSPQNTSNYQQINVESIPGKKRPVAFRVQDPYCFDLCKVDLNCNQTPVYIDHATKEVVFDLTGAPFRHCDGTGEPVVLRFDETDLMKFCTETDQSIIQRDIAAYLLRFEQALDKQLGNVFATLVGHNGKDEAITNIPFWVQSTNIGVQAINPTAVWYLNQVFSDMGMNGQYALLGGMEVNKIAAFQKWIANNEIGVDMSKANDLNPYMFYNRNLESVLGVQDMIMAAPGTVQFVRWNMYKGEKRRAVTDLYTHGTVVLPTTGLEVDYEWVYDYKCKVWTFECFLYGELVANLPGGCGASLANTNGLIRIHDCSAVGVVPECPAAT